MSQNQTDTTHRRRTATPDDETDAPLVPDLGRRDGVDTEPYRPAPFDRMLMRDAE